ncbi:MAG: beta/gamma crystallin-related protein [Casimicrobiaceae bacterium]
MKRMLAPLLTGIILAAAGAAAADGITFYEQDNYGGRQLFADRPMANFGGTALNDRVRSAVVHEGRWEICVDADFNGGCGILAPGAYPNLGAYADRISSARPVDGRNSGMRNDDRGRGRQARATLFEGQNLTGRAYQLNDTMPNMGNTGFNDRASSLRVESGYWIFCSDSDFRGECRTFGPGDYASLSGMNNAISSGRRISNEYPYNDKPDWQRGAYRQSQNSRSQ